MRNTYIISVEKPERKGHVGIHRRRWEDDIEMGRKDVDWMHVAQDRDKWQALVNTTMNLQVPYNWRNSLTS
jgi:hypothetical protein